MSMDINKVGALLHIVEKSLGHPKLQALTESAMRELEAHAANAKEELAKIRADEKAKAEEEAVERASQAKAAEEENARKAKMLIETPLEPNDEDPVIVGGESTTSADVGRRL